MSIIGIKPVLFRSDTGRGSDKQRRKTPLELKQPEPHSIRRSTRPPLFRPIHRPALELGGESTHRSRFLCQYASLGGDRNAPQAHHRCITNPVLSRPQSAASIALAKPLAPGKRTSDIACVHEAQMLSQWFPVLRILIEQRMCEIERFPRCCSVRSRARPRNDWQAPATNEQNLF